MNSEIPRDLEHDLRPRRGPALLITRNNVKLAPRLAELTPGLDWTVLTKQDVRGWSANRLRARLREKAWTAVVIEDRVQEMTRRPDLYRLMILCSRGQTRWLLSTGNDEFRTVRVKPFREWPIVLAAILAESLATFRALFDAWRLNRRLAGADHPVPSTTHGSRVAVLRTSFWFGVRAGGSVSHALGVLRGMNDLALEPRLWTSSRLPAESCPVPQVEISPSRHPSFLEEAAVAAFNRTFVDAVEEEIRRFDPAVIYHRHDAFSLAGVALARKLGVPLVLEVNASEVWAREAWSRLHFGGLARSMERTAFRMAERLVLISEELVPIVTQLGGDRDRIVVSPNGVDVSRFRPDDDGSEIRARLELPEDAVVCGFLGTFTEWHGVLFLAKQVAKLVERDSRLHFLFLGDGDLRPEVELQLEEDGVARNGRFTGLVDPQEVPVHLAACDILLSPHLPFHDGSPFFGSPTKLFEYMAAGRPVVASRLGQIGSVVNDGKTGILVPPGDAEAFRAAIHRLASNSAERESMGRHGRETAEAAYTWRANVERALNGLVEFPTQP